MNEVGFVWATEGQRLRLPDDDSAKFLILLLNLGETLDFNPQGRERSHLRCQT